MPCNCSYRFLKLYYKLGHTDTFSHLHMDFGHLEGGLNLGDGIKDSGWSPQRKVWSDGRKERVNVSSKQVESPWLHDGRARGRHEAHCHLSLCKHRVFWDDGWYTFYKLPPLAIAMSFSHGVIGAYFGSSRSIVHKCAACRISWDTSGIGNGLDD